ncbi:MAG: DUF1266 domain-containing protein [Bryobacterales bacterium]|nr:DUF1266 domain-containing protein [Bryobacterales bacterium]
MRLLLLVVVFLSALPAEPLSAEKRWALAMTPILAARWQGDWQSLGMIEDTTSNRQRIRESILQGWGVNSRAGLDRAIADLIDRGHNSTFLRLASCGDCEDGYDPLQLKIVRQYAPEFGKRGIAAWDLIRAAGLAQHGYRAGYYTESEAWAQLLPIARRARSLFHSWEQFQWNYVIGRRFWAPRQEEVNRFTFFQYANLLWDAKSPWRNIPWNLDQRIDTPPAVLVIYIRPAGLTCFDLILLDRPAEPSFLPQLEAVAGCKLKVLDEKLHGRDFRLAADCRKPIVPAPLPSEYRLSLAALWPRLRNFAYSHLLVQIRQIPHATMTLKPDAEHVYPVEGELHAWHRFDLRTDAPVLTILHKH